jgi:hypothetical protein
MRLLGKEKEQQHARGRVIYNKDNTYKKVVLKNTV